MQYNFLIVDDSSFMRGVLKRYLDMYDLPGKNILEASNGREALDILKTKNVDCVFTDLNMPHYSGEELLEKIKSSPDLLHIPVIVITSLLNPAGEQKLLNKKATAILQKPVTLPQINKILTQQLNVTRGV